MASLPPSSTPMIKVLLHNSFNNINSSNHQKNITGRYPTIGCIQPLDRSHQLQQKFVPLSRGWRVRTLDITGSEGRSALDGPLRSQGRR
eukprot:766206-Hanusia_phi.AAC.6